MLYVYYEPSELLQDADFLSTLTSVTKDCLSMSIM